MSTEQKFSIGEAIRFGWETVKKNLGFWIGISAIYFVLTSLHYSFKSESANYQVTSLVSSIFGIILSIGIIKISLKFIDGKKAEFRDLFKDYRLFWRMLGAQILIVLIVILGLILLIIPGIYWSLKYQFTQNFIIDRNMGIREAMRASAKATEGIKTKILVFDFAIFGVILLGALALGVGILVAFPVAWIADCFVYRKLLKGMKKVKEEVPAEA